MSVVVAAGEGFWPDAAKHAKASEAKARANIEQQRRMFLSSSNLPGKSANQFLITGTVGERQVELITPDFGSRDADSRPVLSNR